MIFFLAFVSLGLQIDGLLGPDGILPATQYLTDIAGADSTNLPPWAFPSLLWLFPTDATLHFLCWGGALAALGVALGVAAAPLLIVAWLFYLSLVNVGQDFLSFQWDILLLETGFLSIVWSQWKWLSSPWRGNRLDRTAASGAMFFTGLWLLRWLLFKLMLFSGLVKIFSGDPTWASFKALQFHYWTQPLPTPLAWLANQLPDQMQSAAVIIMFAIELLVPFLFFFPRKIRHAAAALTAFLQIGILLTGNYAFFNWLTLALCLTMLDDQIVSKLLPKRLRLALEGEALEVAERPLVASGAPGAPGASPEALVKKFAVGALLAIAIGAQVSNFIGFSFLPQPLRLCVRQLHLASSYGLFAVMTTTRPEIQVEGSNDGVNWTPYVFKYKPGPLNRPPPIVAPHQPRLDWQMWFAALGPVAESPWFANFVTKLLQGAPDVVQLLETNPFPAKPPQFIRAMLFEYRFTTIDELRNTGNWWKRTAAGVFMTPKTADELLFR